jgi:hypothetical protein
VQSIVRTLDFTYNYGCSISEILSIDQQMWIVEIVISSSRIGVAKIQEVKSEDHLSLSGHIATWGALIVKDMEPRVCMILKLIFLRNKIYPLSQMIYVQICSWERPQLYVYTRTIMWKI